MSKRVMEQLNALPHLLPRSSKYIGRRVTSRPVRKRKLPAGASGASGGGSPPPPRKSANSRFWRALRARRRRAHLPPPAKKPPSEISNSNACTGAVKCTACQPAKSRIHQISCSLALQLPLHCYFLIIHANINRSIPATAAGGAILHLHCNTCTPLHNIFRNTYITPTAFINRILVYCIWN